MGPKINSGVLDLTILYKAAVYFRQESIVKTSEKAKVLMLLENKSSLECDKIFLELTPKPLPFESVRPVSQDCMQLKININNETHKKLEDVKCLMGLHLIDNLFFSKLVDEAYENIIRKRFKLTSKGRMTTSHSGENPSNYERRTAFENAVEKVCENCGGCFYLQEDHIIPKAFGGPNDPSNLRLLCFHCNQRQRIKAGL